VGQARWAVGALVAAGVIAAAGIGAAATPEQTARARDSFLKGQAHFHLEEYDEALKSFRDAYRFAPDPVLLFNMAQCHAKLGQTDEALRFYRSYLRRAPQAGNRGEVEKRIVELEREAASAPRAPGPPPLAPPLVNAPPPQPPPLFGRLSPAPAPPPLEAASSPIYRRWWFWTGVAVVVVGGIFTAVAVGRRGELGDCRMLPNCRELR
jgi:tetratricopeptide (TPR) repeat protein